MPHHCKAALITCEDFRLHQRAGGKNFVAEFIKNLNCDCDLITRGGGVQDLVRPACEGYEKCLLKDLNVSTALHRADTIHLINHEDCGAYSQQKFFSREEELKKHHDDLKKAKEIINNKFPGKKVLLYFAELEPGADDIFVVKEI